MLGTVIGDIVGSAYALRNQRDTHFQPLFHPRARHTGITVGTVGVAHALLTGADPASALRDWCRRHAIDSDWSRPFSAWITADRATPCTGPDNGAALRVAPAGLLARSIEDALGRALRVTVLTHDHPEAIRGALAVAATIRWAREGLSAECLREAIGEHFAYDLDVSVDTLRAVHQRSDISARSVPPAIVCALQATSFENALRNAVSIGGDSAAIAAMAGGIAEARFGIPANIAQAGWAFLSPGMRAVISRLYAEARFCFPYPHLHRRTSSMTGKRPDGVYCECGDEAIWRWAVLSMVAGAFCAIVMIGALAAPHTWKVSALAFLA